MAMKKKYFRDLNDDLYIYKYWSIKLNVINKKYIKQNIKKCLFLILYLYIIIKCKFYYYGII